MKKILALVCVLALLLTSFAFAEEDRLGGLTLPLVDKDDRDPVLRLSVRAYR